VDTIAAAVANANGRNSNGAAAAAAAGDSKSVTNAAAAAKPRGKNNPYDKLMQLGTTGTPAAGKAVAAAGGVTNGVSNGADAAAAANKLADEWDEEEGARDEDVTAGQTWMVLEYCDRGCLQVRQQGWFMILFIDSVHLHKCC
jgi:hypothetical protein